MESNTTFLLSNLHCPSCVKKIEETLELFGTHITSVSTSIVSQSVTIRHDFALSLSDAARALVDAGFDIHGISRDGVVFDLPSSLISENEDSSPCHVSGDKAESAQKAVHLQSCDQCRVGQRSKSDSDESAIRRDEKATEKGNEFVVSPPPDPLIRALLSIDCMSCSSCVGKITEVLNSETWIKSTNVNLLANSATVEIYGRNHLKDIVEIIEGIGYTATVEETEEVEAASTQSQRKTDEWHATYSVDGMTCSACVGKISSTLKNLSWVKKADVNLISKSAVVTLIGKEHAEMVVKEIESIGYEAHLETLEDAGATPPDEEKARTVTFLVDGMHCEQCPQRITASLEGFHDSLQVDGSLDMKNKKMRVTYTPQPPNFTIRNILDRISAVDPRFSISIYHPPTVEERARKLQRRHQGQILYRLLLSVIVAIPALIIGIVFMTLVSSENAIRRYLMQPIWSGDVSRAEWSLFLMTTPVYIFAADLFHRRAARDIWILWRPGSKVPVLRRFYRFGSMDMLISFGTTIAYISSVVELAINATRTGGMEMQYSSTYFDAVVFLTLFLLCGRLIEAYSKAKTGNAVALLGSLRPTETLLVDDAGTRSIPTDLLENGDRVRVLPGASPPTDGVIVEGQSNFDESSLTGEAKPIKKTSGDEVFSGTVNQNSPVSVRVTGVGGKSMLDQIINVVREGQTRRAPIERVADLLTSYFVPAVTLVAVLDWIIWLSLGLSGALPADYLDFHIGGWPFWSLQFAIAVFVIACPCGIGLAAPTALFVGTGLAAKYGILVKSGGEAFQASSKLDCLVFDKTGTLTMGANPAITDHQFLSSVADPRAVLGMAMAVEEGSGHSLAKAVKTFCRSKEVENSQVLELEEIGGKGMKGTVSIGTSDLSKFEVLIGNEALVSEHVFIPQDVAVTLEKWKREAKSVILMVIREVRSQHPASSWALALIMAVSDPIRPESPRIIRTLQSAGYQTWMLSGDNIITARAVASSVGIPLHQVIAGVLPEQKAAKITYLQSSLSPSARPGNSILRRIRFSKQKRRALVAMVGDGINDSPALAAADVGIAMGSGAAVAVAAADFVLLAPGLTPLLTALELGKKVFRRVKFNFGWALVYNMIGLPVAAGVLYPVRSGGQHVRLDPIWASLAMALSSISVVCSSLLLRSKLPGLGFRAGKMGE